MPKIYGVDTSTTSVGGGISAFYRFDSTTTVADPGEGKYRFDNSTPASVTTVAISKTDGDGFARTGIGLLRDGDAILFSATHHSISQAYELTAEPIDNTTWYNLFVTLKLTNGSFSDNDHTEVTAIFSGASAYTELSDVPESFTDDAGKLVAVNGTESGLEHRILTSTDIPSLDASKITTGTLDPTIIPDLSANKITSDTLSVDRIPNLSANKITSDLIGTARLATGTANSTTFLRGDQTWQTISSGGVTVQADPPTATTNATLGSQIYSTNDNRKYLCIDSTTNANVWAYWNRDGAQTLEFTASGTFTESLSMEDPVNQAFFRRGALYYLGTSGLTAAYSNVHTSGRCVVTMSTVGLGSSAAAVDRTINRVFTPNTPGSWYRFDFGTRPFIANRIVWQHGESSAGYALQHYKYQGSNDATTNPTNWVDIATYTAAPPANLAYSFKNDTFVNTTAFRHYRILSTGLDTSGSSYVCITDIEFFGQSSTLWTFP